MAKFKVVTGFPGSGKSTYVQKNKKDADLIFDYDSIMNALTDNEFWSKNHIAHGYVVKIMELMIAKGKNDNKVDTIWIIRSVPDKEFKNKLVDLDVKYFYLNVPTQECLNRIKSDEKRMKSGVNFANIIMSVQNDGLKGAFEGCEWIDNY